MEKQRFMQAKATRIVLSAMIACAFVLLAAGSTESGSSSSGNYDSSSESTEYYADTTSTGSIEQNTNDVGTFSSGAAEDNSQDEQNGFY